MWEETKRLVETVSGLGRPNKDELKALVRPMKPDVHTFGDDGETPNNPLFPLIIYRGAVARPGGFDPAAIFEELFAARGWTGAWRNGIYPFLHFHTKTHEVLGIARGRVRIQFGGNNGKAITLRAGDVAILPAGTGHRRVSQSRDLLVVGAYPPGNAYDEPRPSEVKHSEAVASIGKVRSPASDPVYGKFGPLATLWPEPARRRPAARPSASRAAPKAAKRGRPPARQATA